MSTEEKIVVIEDVDAESKRVIVNKKEDAAAEDVTKTTTAVVTATATASTSASGPVKRQRTLFEMMSSATNVTSGNASKKQKILVASSSTSAAVAPSLSQDSEASTSENAGEREQSLNSIPFSLSAFQESLTEEQLRLLQLECETMGKSWLKVLKDEITKPYFIQLKKFLWSEGVQGPVQNPNLQQLKVYPAPNDVYTWSHTPLGRVRVVIIGQDPYHGPGQAHGLCFSVRQGVATPRSLRNIYAELKLEYPGFQPPRHGNLSAWADDGVLLLNTCLTVRSGAAGSHSNKGWEQFTDKVIQIVDKYGGANLPTPDSGKAGVGRGIVFMAWGAWAAKRVRDLDQKKHLILKSAHPSPLSASRGFMGNGHFRKANEWLEQRYGKEGLIDWSRVAE